MLGEIIVTLIVGAGIAFVVFLLFFNKEEEADIQKGKKKHHNKGKKKDKPKQTSTQSAKKPDKKRIYYRPNVTIVKPKINLKNHENLVSVFRAHQGDITGVTWHESGEYLISSSKDKYIYVYENPTTPQVTDTYIGCVKAQDGGYFSCVNTVINYDNLINKKNKNAVNDQKIKTKTKTKWVEKYDNIANTVFAATNNGYGLNSYQLKFAATSHKIRLQITSNIRTEFKEDIRYICVHKDLLFGCVSGSHQTKICFYDIKSKQKQQKGKKIKLYAPTNKSKKNVINSDSALQVIDGGQFINYQMSISNCGEYLSIGSFKKDIRIWKINWIKPSKKAGIKEIKFGSMELLTHFIDAHSGSVTCVQFSCDSQYLISGSKDGSIKVWDIINVDYARGEKIKLLMETSINIRIRGKLIGISLFVISNQFDALAVLDDMRKVIYIYHINYEKEKIKFIFKLDGILCDKNKGQINVMRFSPNCQYIAVGTTDMDVRVYKIPKHKHKSKK